MLYIICPVSIEAQVLWLPVSLMKMAGDVKLSAIVSALEPAPAK